MNVHPKTRQSNASSQRQPSPRRRVGATFGCGREAVFARRSRHRSDATTGVRTASRNTYDADGRVTQVDKGTTNATGANFTALETTTTAFDPNGNKIHISVLNGPFGSLPLPCILLAH